MHLIYFTKDILHLHAFSGLVSWAVVVGGGYGAVRLVVDVAGFVRRDLARAWRESGK